MAAWHDMKERSEIQQESLYVVSDPGRERFIWATSTADARVRAALARTSEPASISYGHALVLGTASSRLPD